MTADVCVLAYSGGLDTSVAIRWLHETKGYDIIALAVDVGQGDDLEAVRSKALRIGAVDSVVVDARDEFAERYIARVLKANALYEGKYPVVSSLSRPLIASHLVRVARAFGAGAVGHGCTGKGNDQVRVEVSVRALAPDLTIEAPIREHAMSRTESQAYAEAHGIPVPTTTLSPYSVDQNLWGRACECGVLEDPWQTPPKDAYAYTRDPGSVLDPPRDVVVTFTEGVPSAIDGRPVTVAEAIVALNEVGGGFGFGRIDMIENRLVGIKSREVYEAPGALALITAHRDLEDLVLDRHTHHYKARLEAEYATLVYNGLWFTPLRRALDAFIDETQRQVCGDVRLTFGPGSCHASGRRSAFSLYDESLATYTGYDTFRHDAAEGFVKIWGMPAEVWAQKSRAAGGAADPVLAVEGSGATWDE